MVKLRAHRQVFFTITVKISHGDTPDRVGRAQRRLRRWYEPSFAIAQEYSHQRIVIVSRHQVNLTVTIEIGHRHVARSRAERKWRTGRRREPRLSITEHHHHRIPAQVRSNDV